MSKVTHITTMVKTPAGPAEFDWCTTSTRTREQVVCHVCGTVHPELTDRDKRYSLSTLFGMPLVDECCGRILDMLYTDLGEAFMSRRWDEVCAEVAKEMDEKKKGSGGD